MTPLRIFSIASFAFVAVMFFCITPTVLAGEYGTHVYDTPSRRSVRATRSLSYKRKYLYDPYYRRTVTHALHPYYRNHYSSVLVSDRSGRRNIPREIYLAGFPFYKLSSPTQCTRYSFVRDNYRMPPKDFRCLQY